MTYASFGAVGWTKPCKGLEVQEEGFCCPDGEWFNYVYAAIKGPNSLQYHNEKRVRHAIGLLNPVELADAAWDMNAQRNPLFEKAIVRAANNFIILHGTDKQTRWNKYKCVVETPDCGCYSIWRKEKMTDAPPMSIAAALGDMGRRTEILSSTTDELNVINGVPSSGPHRFRADMPVRTELWTVADGKVAPTAWTRSFLDVFAPGWDRMRITAAGLRRMAVAKAPKFTANVRGALAREALVGPEPSDEAVTPPPAEEPKTGQYLAVGGAALLLVGMLGWTVMRRRR